MKTISYFDAEQKVLKKMSLNPTIPSEMFDTLVHDEFLGTEVCKAKYIELKQDRGDDSGKHEYDLGTEPEDWDLVNDGMAEQEVLE